MGCSGTVRTRQDELREQALEAYDVLGRPPRRELEALVALAAKAAGVPRASINLFTAFRQWQIATYGFEGRVSDREDAMCRYVLQDAQPILLADASLDDRFRDDSSVNGRLGRVRCYASHPLVTPDGVVLGTLSVCGDQPHEVDPEIVHTLATLSGCVVDVLQLELTSRELAAASQRLGVFAGQVSHGLRNPLAAVRMSLELIREELGDDGEAGLLDLLERAERGTRRMDDMIGELLTFARVGEIVDPTAVDLAVVVQEVLEDLAGVADADRFVIGDLPTVHGDAVQLRVLLHTLLGNAVRLAPAGTPVTISTTALDPGWRISITDLGPGVSVEDRERVFDPMVRPDTRVPGIGIDLVTCRRIVEAHRGRIGVAENPHGGASLWFELPG